MTTRPPDPPTAPVPVPHRYPFRFIDRTAAPRLAGDGARAEPPSTGLSAGAVMSAVGRANRAPSPGGHPLSLLIEIMAQGALAALSDGSAGGAVPDGASLRLAGVDDAVLHAPVEPGDRLTVEAWLEGRFGGLSKVSCRLLREGTPVAEAKLLLAGT